MRPWPTLEGDEEKHGYGTRNRFRFRLVVFSSSPSELDGRIHPHLSGLPLAPSCPRP